MAKTTIILTGLSLFFFYKDAAAVRVECLGQPCMAKSLQAGQVVKEPDTGKEWLVLTNDNEQGGMELTFVDFRQNTAATYRAPGGTGAWTLKQVPGGRLVVGTYTDGNFEKNAKFLVFDLKTKTFVQSIDFPGEQYILDMAMGTDGRLYAGTNPHAKLGALNLDNYTLEDCNAPAGGNLYLRSLSSIPNGGILCRFEVENKNKIYYPATKQYLDPPSGLINSKGTAWNGYFLAGNGVYSGNPLTKLAPSFPTPEGYWDVEINLTTLTSLYFYQGHKIYRHLAGSPTVDFIADVDLKGGRFFGSGEHGELLGVRGQDYFVVKSGDKQLHPLPIPTETSPRNVKFLKVDSQNRVWGGPCLGQTLFWMDTASKTVTNTPSISDSDGEVYDVAFIGGKVYAVSYSQGEIIRYDPSQPWDQWNRINPKTIAQVGPAYIRPNGGVVVGPDGKLYSGWMATYGVYGGAVARTDPATGATELIENPLGTQAINAMAVDDKCVYLGTSLYACGLPKQSGQGVKFGVLDLQTKKIVYSYAFPDAEAVDAMGYDPPTKKVAMCVKGKLWVFDTVNRRFITDLPANTPPVSNGILAVPGTGKVYYGVDNNLICGNLQKKVFSFMTKLPSSFYSLAVGPDGSVYAACNKSIYRVRLR